MKMPTDNDIISNLDYEQLNALADGELQKIEAIKLMRRVSEEPPLQIAYDGILKLKKQLSSSFPIESDDRYKKASSAKFTMINIAASIAVIISIALFSLTHWSSAFEADDLMAEHKRFLNMKYVIVKANAVHQVSASSNIQMPDFTQSKLYLVDSVTLKLSDNKSRTFVHYRGRNGCSVTFYSGDVPADPLNPIADQNYRSWVNGSRHFSMIATKMDASRFSSLADYAENFTKTQLENRELILAMQDEHKSSQGCNIG